MSKRNYDIDNEYLVNSIIEGKSIRDLSREFNCCPACIFKRIKKYNGGLKEDLEKALKKNYLNSNNKRWKKNEYTN